MKSKIEKPYSQEFVSKILQGEKDIADGKGKGITLKELQELGKSARSFVMLSGVEASHSQGCHSVGTSNL